MLLKKSDKIWSKKEIIITFAQLSDDIREAKLLKIYK